MEGKYFDLNEAETENSLFLISWNEEKHGMTLWCIDKNIHELKMVRPLSNLPWNLSTENKATVKLRGEDKNNRYDFIIAEKS